MGILKGTYQAPGRGISQLHPITVLHGMIPQVGPRKRATVDSQSASHMELPGAMMPVLPNPSDTLESGFAREVSKQSLRVPSSGQPAAGSWMLILVKFFFFLVGAFIF